MGNRKQQLAEARAYAVQGLSLYLERADIGLEVYRGEPYADGSVVARCFIGAAGKPRWAYRFRSDAELDGYVAREISSREASLRAKAERRAEQAQPVAVAVGDVFEASWGYDQTNIDYYQVVRVVGPKTVEIRQIGAVVWDTGMMQGRSVPSVDSFIGRPMVKRVKPTGDGGAAVMIASYCHAYRIEPVIPGVPAYASSAWSSYA